MMLTAFLNTGSVKPEKALVEVLGLFLALCWLVLCTNPFPKRAGTPLLLVSRVIEGWNGGHDGIDEDRTTER